MREEVGLAAKERMGDEGSGRAVLGKTGVEGMNDLKKALHDMCQPLTTLQCRLEMAGVVGTADAYREAVELGLVECSRLLSAVDAMREVVRAEARDAKQAGAEQ